MNYQNDNYLSHHGVEGMKWGVRHDPERKGYGNRRHHNQKDQPQLSQREIAKRERTAYKKKKLPKTSLGLLLRNRNLSEAEYRQAKKKIERDRDVYEGFLRDIQNIQRTLDIPVNALNSGVKTVKNIDYINTLFGGTSFTDRKTSTRNNKWKKKFDSELKIVHSDMNLPSLVHSDTEDIDNFLCHYGVLGMKWGVHRAREHEKNIYRHNIANGMSRKDAKQEYRNRMSGVKQYAKANRKTGMKVKDISSGSHEEARNRIDNYDKKLRNQRIRKGVAAGLGAAALGAAGFGAYKGIKAYKKKKADDNFKFKRDAIRSGIKFLTPDRINIDTYPKVNPRRGTRNKLYKSTISKSMKVPSEETRWKRSYDLEKNRLVNKAIQGIKNTGSSGTIDITELVKRRMGGLYHSDTITIPSLQHDDMKDVDNYLCHYGRKGMKWGHHIFSDPNQPLSKEYLRYFNNDGSLNRFGQRVINYHGGTSKKHRDFIDKHKYEMKERLHNTKQKKDNEYSDNNIYFEGTGKTTKGKKYIKNLAKQISLGKVTEFTEDKKGQISSTKTQKGKVIRDADGNRVIWGDYLAAERIANKRGYVY